MKHPKGVDATLAVFIIISMLILLTAAPHKAQPSSSVPGLGVQELT